MSLQEKYNALIKENQSLKAENKKLKSLLGLDLHAGENQSNTTSKREVVKQSNKSKTIDKNSPPEEKIKWYMSLFRSRKDVYARRWENRSGRSGYSPVCSNEWKPGICNKPRVKCTDCPHQQFEELNESVIEKHLKGETAAGIYPMLQEDTCYFLAMDFDDEGWQKDIAVLRQVCKEKNIPFTAERSRSGNGAHLWFFFEKPVTALLARKFGTAMLSYAMNQRHEIQFKSYDRFFPNQDTMPKGGFGNLIALPLQKSARKEGNSVFIDEDFKPYPDQWSYLSSINKISEEQIVTWLRQLSGGNELGTLRAEEDNEQKPWEKKSKSAISSGKNDFPKSLTLVKADRIYIPKEGISQKGLNTLKRLAAFGNPQFYKAQAMRMPVYNKPRIISCADETSKYLCLPRGCETNIENLLSAHHHVIHWTDKRSPGKRIEVQFTGKLRKEQQQAIDALFQYDHGILSAPPAFGKTVISAKIISEKKINTFILVHRRQLLLQWTKRLTEFLNVLPNQIGQLGGGKTHPTMFIDIAMIQSFIRNEKIQGHLKDYGMVIVDECHHVPAFSFEQVIKKVNAKYVYGLTATPERHDGRHPIVFMQCGPIRYKADIKKQAEKRPFDHYVIPRFTGFILPENTDPERAESKWPVQEIYREIVMDDM